MTMNLKIVSLVLIILTTISSKASYDVQYLKKLAPEVENSLTQLKKALSVSWDGYFLNAISPAATLAGREPIELESVYRFKIVSKTKTSDFENWIEKQNDASVRKILAHVDQHTSKKTLIEWQNGRYQEYLTLEEAFERLVQTQHFTFTMAQRDHRTTGSL